MQHDKKVGLALAILLVSIVGAFFFREEGQRGRGTPELKNPEQLDRAIAQGRDKLPYNDANSGPKPQTHEVRRPTDRSKNDVAPWELPDFLRDDTDRQTASRAKVNGSKDPFTPNETMDETVDRRVASPVPQFRAPVDNRATAVPLPLENSDWEPVDRSNRVARRESATGSGNVGNTRTHVVASGETLSSIAEKYLGSQARFQDIFQANRDQLRSPNDLKIGMKLTIPDRAASGKSSDTSRNLDANKATTERSTKSARPTFTAPTSKVTGKSTESNESSTDTPTKLKFKPAKPNSTLRRSADADEELEPGKVLSQVTPDDFSEVEEGVLAELEQDMDSSGETERLATEPSPFRVASEETENAGLDD